MECTSVEERSLAKKANVFYNLLSILPYEILYSVHQNLIFTTKLGLNLQQFSYLNFGL
jgi:hypothetical protein